MKKFLIFIVIILFLFCLCGCYDSQEIDKSAYVIALGIDKGKSGYNYTFQISSPLAMGGGGEVGASSGGEKNSRVENIVIGSNSLINAKTSLNNFLSKKASLSHLKIIIFSEEVAKIGLSPHLPFLLREREIRPTTRLAVSLSKAEDFLNGINPALEANTAEYYDLVFENGGAYAPPKTLWEFVNEQETFASALPCGLLSSGEKSDEFSGEASSPNRISTSKAEFSGLYLMKNYKLSGRLTPEQSQIHGLLSGQLNEAEFSVTSNNKNHSFKIFPNRKSKYSVRQTDNATTLSCTAGFTAEVNSSDSNLNSDFINNFLDTKAHSLFSVLKETNCDILQTGNTLKRKCKTVNEWENLDWNKNFNKIYFFPEFSVTISKTDSAPI